MATTRSTKLSDEWLGVESALSQSVESFSRNQLKAYKEHPPLVREHANLERAVVEGGYGRQQLYELVQNAADELIGIGGRVEVVLTDEALYCANEGEPFSVEGTEAILASYLSAKRGVEIGRFGLGFKSVLGVTHRPQVFSRSGSFGFDADYARDSIQRMLPDEKATPVLRIGRALDPRREAADDSVLAELMAWATTVIKLNRTGGGGWIADDFARFPPEFLIFCPHVTMLVLDDRTPDGKCRRYSVVQSGDDVTLATEDGATTWHVSKHVHHPSLAAKRDGGYSADRDEVPVYWAASHQGLGRLWAFFPTREVTTASGIFNAPWKLTDDRTSVIEGPFNDELLACAADLFVSNLDHVVDPSDPGALMEMFPARGKELRGYADETIMKRVYAAAPAHPVLPDQEGQLRLPSALTLHPEELPATALVMWAKSETRPVDWVHYTVESKGNRATRRSRAERLIAEGGGRRARFAEWLLALIDEQRPVESARRALLVAESIATQGTDKHKEELRELPIVLTADEVFVRPIPGQVYLPSEDGMEADVPLVHPELVANDYVIQALRALGIDNVSQEALLDAQLQDASRRPSAADWEAIWRRARQTSGDLLPALLAKHSIDGSEVRVRTRAGAWSRLGGVLLVGRVLREDELEKDDLYGVLDEDWHGVDLDTLRHLGLRQGPVDQLGSVDEPWGARYLKAAYDTYRARCQRTKPADTSIEIDNLGKFAGPASPLINMSARPAARFLAAAFEQTRNLRHIEIRHRTKSDMPIVRFPHPLVWLLKEQGVVLTSLGPMPLDCSVGPTLSDFRRVLPVADVPDAVAAQLELPASLDQLEAPHWKVAHGMVMREEDPDRLVELYGTLCSYSPVPDRIRAMVRGEVGEYPAMEVALAESDRDIRLLRESGKPYLPCFASSTAELLASQWGFVRAMDLIDSELFVVPEGPGEPLGDLFPMLGSLLTDEQLHIELQRCAELRRDWFTDSGRVAEQLVVERDGEALYVATAVDTDEKLLRLVSETLGLALGAQDIQAILENAAEQSVAELARAMRTAGDDAERLLLAVDVDVLRQRLPKQLIDAYADIHGDPDDKAVAELTLAALGFEALSELAPFLRERGLQAPTNWAGSRRAIQFVRDLGFDRGYAGFKNEGRDEVLDVEGPIDLPMLHEYQRTAADAIKELVSGTGSLRGLLSLPTGAGKTRVTVQALVEAMFPERDGMPSPVLWIAQTDELCEQAVQSWAEVWRAIGPPRPLRISRLWSTNQGAPVDEGDQVVVATISKLNAIEARVEYEWLTEATCVVIDEAHASTETSYTSALRWLGMGGGRERVPLLGLSATPFRGASESANRSLAARYGNRRLDFGAFRGDTPSTKQLQAMGILADVDHEVLEGASVPMNDKELSDLNSFGRLPASVLARLGENVDRNRRLLESLLAKPEDWPILVFASSVPHAQTLAALLAKQGRPAAAVSSETNRSVRRYLVERFKRGEIKVLTNYGVLTQGFDAPAIRALYIARPTYSENRYQQMVGRGLRGPLNGGKERCLVVNVADNLERYGGKLAFHEFDYLWNE